jgi:hypothetical protein
VKRILSNTIPGNAQFIATLQYVMEQTWSTMNHSLFDSPVELSDDTLSYLLSQKQFKHFSSLKSLKEAVRQYPVELPKVQVIWDLMAHRFKRILETKWADAIAKRIEQTFGSNPR